MSDTNARRRPSRTVRPISFKDLSGEDFERLVLAYQLRSQQWRSLEWYGQVGSDLGRDLWGVLDCEAGREEVSVCVQCANRSRLAFAKVSRDLKSAASAPNGRPDRFQLVTGGTVSATLRDRIRAQAQPLGIQVEVLSGVEFEERLRTPRCESLLRRFFEGEEFPDDPTAMRSYLSSLEPATDTEILARLSPAFDRPAFYTPFRSEACLPDFRKAITDTIEALGTGVRRLRDGTEIERGPSRHELRDKVVASTLATIERRLVRLRQRFDELMHTTGIRRCECSNPACPVYFFEEDAIREMDQLRTEILDDYRRVYPALNVRVGC